MGKIYSFSADSASPEIIKYMDILKEQRILSEKIIELIENEYWNRCSDINKLKLKQKEIKDNYLKQILDIKNKIKTAQNQFSEITEKERNWLIDTFESIEKHPDWFNPRLKAYRKIFNKPEMSKELFLKKLEVINGGRQRKKCD